MEVDVCILTHKGQNRNSRGSVDLTEDMKVHGHNNNEQTTHV